MPRLWDISQQIRRTIGAAHGLSGWLLGATAFILYEKPILKCREEEVHQVIERMPRADCGEDDARAFFKSESLFMVWIGYRDAVRLQNCPGMVARWEIADIAIRLCSTPPRRRKNTIDMLKIEVADLLKDERMSRKKPMAEQRDIYHQIEKAIAAAHRIEEWLKATHGSCPSPDASEKKVLAALGTYELYVVWTGYRDAVRLKRFKPVLQLETEMARVAKAFLHAKPRKKRKHLKHLLTLAGHFKRAERECAALFPKGMSEKSKSPPKGAE